MYEKLKKESSTCVYDFFSIKKIISDGIIK